MQMVRLLFAQSDRREIGHQRLQTGEGFELGNLLHRCDLLCLPDLCHDDCLREAAGHGLLAHAGIADALCLRTGDSSTLSLAGKLKTLAD